MAKYIKPLNNKQSIKNDNINLFFADFETVIHNNQHYVTCYSFTYYVKKTQEFKTNTCVIDVSKSTFNIEDDSFNLIKLFLESIVKLSKKSPTNIIYFHNLGKFDSMFLVNFFIKNNQLNRYYYT